MLLSTPCPFCANDRVDKIRSLTSPFNGKMYVLHSCIDCGLEFFTPLVFEEDIYNNEEVDGYDAFHQGRTSFPPWTKALLKIIENLQLNLKGKTFLEIGAGDGINYIALNTLCPIPPENYYVVEMDAKSLRQCQKRGLIHLIGAKFDRTILEQIHQRFDMIFMLEVLEHQTNPKEFLATAFDLLQPNGMLLLTVPNRNRFFLKSLEFEGDLPPHHFLRFDPKFFRNNLGTHLLYITNIRLTSRIKNLKNAAIKCALQLGIPLRFWWVCAPCVPILQWIRYAMAYFQGEGLVVILNKKKN